jgi:beta,beta-carotene 9',10'-dioxygenase
MTTVDLTDPAAATTRGLGFRSMEEELALDDLQVDGTIPCWLIGSLVRATPALYEIGGKATRHFFDGLAMLNMFAFADGVVSYRSRFLDTNSYRKARQGRVDYIGLGNDPCRAFFKRVSALFDPSTINDNANVSVARLGERYLALTEAPFPVEFDPSTLDTEGLMKWDDRVGGHLFSAHPHYDHARDELVSYVVHMGLRSSYRVFALPAGSRTRRLIGTIPVARPCYIHSIGMTERYVVLAEFPLSVDPRRLLLRPSRPLMDQLSWEPGRGTRFFVLDRTSGELHSTHETDGFFAFHHVNAFERAGELVVDLVVHENGPQAIRWLELERLRRPAPFSEWQPRLHRFRLPLSGGPVVDELLSEERLELPRINYRRQSTRSYRFVYGVGFQSVDSDYYDQLIKIDLGGDAAARWSEPGCYPSEPVFVASPDAAGEDGGVILSVVLDARAERSFLLVLDARTMHECGRAAVPHHIPFGFHGDYFDTRRDALQQPEGSTHA